MEIYTAGNLHVYLVIKKKCRQVHHIVPHHFVLSTITENRLKYMMVKGCQHYYENNEFSLFLI